VSSIRDVYVYYAHLYRQSYLAITSILNQCRDIDLRFPVYFIHGGIWHEGSVQKIDISAVMRNRLEFDSEQDILKGILAYKIQRQRAESDKLTQNESKSAQLLVAWCGEYTKELQVRALLVEHDNELDEDKLKSLYRNCWCSLETRIDPIESSWLLDDVTILKITVKVMNGNYRWDISISEGK
jgi:hypothetical protein